MSQGVAAVSRLHADPTRGAGESTGVGQAMISISQGVALRCLESESGGREREPPGATRHERACDPPPGAAAWARARGRTTPARARAPRPSPHTYIPTGSPTTIVPEPHVRRAGGGGGRGLFTITINLANAAIFSAPQIIYLYIRYRIPLLAASEGGKARPQRETRSIRAEHRGCNFSARVPDSLSRSK